MLNDPQSLNRAWLALTAVTVAFGLLAFIVVFFYLGYTLYLLHIGKPLPKVQTHRMFFPAPYLLVLTVIVSGIGELVEYRIKSILQHRLVNCLAASCEHCVVRVGGVPAKHPRELCEAICQIRSFAAHRSHPTDVFLVAIESPHCDKIILELYRDSGIPDEYWVYWPGVIKSSREIELGRIRGLDRELLRQEMSAVPLEESDAAAASEADETAAER